MREHLLIFGTNIRKLLCLFLLSVSTLGPRCSGMTGAWGARVCKVPHSLSSCHTEALNRTVSKSPEMERAEQARSELVSVFPSFFSKIMPTDTHKKCKPIIGGLSFVPLFFLSHKAKQCPRLFTDISQ